MVFLINIPHFLAFKLYEERSPDRTLCRRTINIEKDLKKIVGDDVYRIRLVQNRIISVLILSFHLNLRPPRYILPYSLRKLFAFVSYLFHTCCFPFWFIIQIQITKSSITQCLKPTGPSSFLGPNMFVSNLPNTFHLSPSFNARDQVSHPHKTKDKIIVLS